MFIKSRLGWEMLTLVHSRVSLVAVMARWVTELDCARVSLLQTWAVVRRERR